MTDTDPYAGVRTRENIVEAPDEVEEQFREMRRVIGEMRALTRETPFSTLRQRLQDNSARAMEEIDAEATALMCTPACTHNLVAEPESAFEEQHPVYHPHAFEQNLVPAEDLPAHERIAKLKQLVEDMFADWQKLNEIYNITAQTRDWCSDYEERQHNYNEQFKVLRLVGRPRNWYGSTSNWKSLDGSDYGDNG